MPGEFFLFLFFFLAIWLPFIFFSPLMYLFLLITDISIRADDGWRRCPPFPLLFPLSPGNWVGRYGGADSHLEASFPFPFSLDSFFFRFPADVVLYSQSWIDILVGHYAPFPSLFFFPGGVWQLLRHGDFIVLRGTSSFLFLFPKYGRPCGAERFSFSPHLFFPFPAWESWLNWGLSDLFLPPPSLARSKMEIWRNHWPFFFFPPHFRSLPCLLSVAATGKKSASLTRFPLLPPISFPFTLFFPFLSLLLANDVVFDHNWVDHVAKLFLFPPFFLSRLFPFFFFFFPPPPFLPETAGKD